jgi:hypothetical protein
MRETRCKASSAGGANASCVAASSATSSLEPYWLLFCGVVGLCGGLLYALSYPSVCFETKGDSTKQPTNYPTNHPTNQPPNNNPPTQPPRIPVALEDRVGRRGDAVERRQVVGREARDQLGQQTRPLCRKVVAADDGQRLGQLRAHQWRRAQHEPC